MASHTANSRVDGGADGGAATSWNASSREQDVVAREQDATVGGRKTPARSARSASDEQDDAARQAQTPIIDTAPDLLGVTPDVLQGAGDDARDTHAAVCAAVLFMRDGLASVRMTDIARAAGVGVATLYRRFSTKTHIAIAAATLLWHNFNQRIVQVTRSDAYGSMTGADQIEHLLRGYADDLTANPGFVRFVAEFDRLIVHEHVPARELAAYGHEVDSSYALFEAAYKRGVSDGSARRLEDPKVFYKSVAHALMGVAEKISLGDVIPSDDFQHGWTEIDCLVDMTLKTVRI